MGGEVKLYLEEFGGTAKQEQLMVGKMTLEQVEVSYIVATVYSYTKN